jgi:hypothetical protein
VERAREAFADDVAGWTKKDIKKWLLSHGFVDKQASALASALETGASFRFAMQSFTAISRDRPKERLEFFELAFGKGSLTNREILMFAGLVDRFADSDGNPFAFGKVGVPAATGPGDSAGHSEPQSFS